MSDTKDSETKDSETKDVCNCAKNGENVVIYHYGKCHLLERCVECQHPLNSGCGYFHNIGCSKHLSLPRPIINTHYVILLDESSIV
jgi:hypothetical protein